MSGLPRIQSYWLMLIATVITVAIVNTSQLITQRISLLLDRQASELLAADLVLASGNPFADEYTQQALKLGLRLSRTISLRTAVFIENDVQLVELKAVDSLYPLRGYLEKSVGLANPNIRVQLGPKAGEVWIDSKLLALLDGNVELGRSRLRANWLLTYEPDRGGTLFNLAPRILMNLEDLPLVVISPPLGDQTVAAAKAQSVAEEIVNALIG